MKRVPISKFSTQFYRYRDEIPLVVTVEGEDVYFVMEYNEDIVNAIEEVWGGGKG